MGYKLQWELFPQSEGKMLSQYTADAQSVGMGSRVG